MLKLAILIGLYLFTFHQIWGFMQLSYLASITDFMQGYVAGYSVKDFTRGGSLTPTGANGLISVWLFLRVICTHTIQKS